MMPKEGSTRIVTFKTPRAGFLCKCIFFKKHYFCKNLLLSQAKVRQNKYNVMMTKEESTKIVNFMTSGAWVLMLGRGHIH